ncbi:ribosomal protein S18-alanine N-acetyltransferase [Shewanella putrefaciens]|nr:ribosomal protein S18-alanine N-acetyltransferase [Shewanella putrefaciens]
MNIPPEDSLFTAPFAAQLTAGLPVELVALTLKDVPQMAQLESMAHSHPMSEGNLADCFGHLYRVLGLKQAKPNAASVSDSVDGLLGFAIVQQIVDEVTLLDICLLPSLQGKGYGKLLLKAVVASAKASGAVVLMLEVRESNLAARALYQKAGFIESGRRKGYYPIVGGKEDAILMDLVITQE